MAICSADVVGGSVVLPFGYSAIPCRWIGTRREDAPKRVENIRVPDRWGVVRIAPGEAREDMALSVFGIANLGVSQRETVEEELHQ